MLKIFALCMLFFCAGCSFYQENPDAAYRLDARARQQCQKNMLSVRVAENRQRLRRELSGQILQMTLPGQLDQLTVPGAAAAAGPARQALQLAELYFQELTAPDDAAAHRLLESRSAQLLDLEFAELASRIRNRADRLSALAMIRPEPAAELAETRCDYNNACMEMRTLLDTKAAGFVVSDTPGEELPPASGRLITALANRPELAGSAVPPDELAAAVRAYADGRYETPVHRALSTALLLLRVPRELYKRELADRHTQEGLTELLTALGIGAELALAEYEWKAAEREWDRARLLPQTDPRSRADSAAAREKLDAAGAHLICAMGGSFLPKKDRRKEPSGAMLKLLKMVEKYDHE